MGAKCDYLYIGGMRVPTENVLVTVTRNDGFTAQFRVAAKSPGKDRGTSPTIKTIAELKKLTDDSTIVAHTYNPASGRVMGESFEFDPSRAEGTSGRKHAAKEGRSADWSQFEGNEFVAGLLAKGVSYGASKGLDAINTGQLDWLARTLSGKVVLEKLVKSSDPALNDVKHTLAAAIYKAQKLGVPVPLSKELLESFVKLAPMAETLGFLEDRQTSLTGIRVAPGVDPQKPSNTKPKVVHPGLRNGMGILDATTVARETVGGYEALSEIPKILKSGSLNAQKLGMLRVNNELIAEQSSSGDRVELIEKFKGLDIYEYEENGIKKRIAFGRILESDTLDVTTGMPTIVPMSPYDISGLSRQSEEGRQIAYDYAHALAATRADDTGVDVGDYSVSQVNALLYAGFRGDETALSAFVQMVETGRRKVAVERARLTSIGSPGMLPGGRVDPFIKVYPAKVTPGTAEYEILLALEGEAGVAQVKKNYESSRGAAIDECIQTAKDIGLYAEDVTQTDTSNLFLFHEKELSMGGFETNEQGDLLLRPVGDWQTTDSGMQFFNELDPESSPFLKGDPRAKFHRRTIHLGINGPVAPVENNGGLAGGRVVKSAIAVMVRLDDAVDANPGSVDNITSFDTFMTPPSGRPLVIPRGKYRILSKAEGENWSIDGGSTTVEDVAVALGADREKFAAQQFKRRGDLPDPVDGASAALSRVASGKYGAGYSGHEGTVQQGYDKFNVGHGEDPILTARNIASASQNWASSHYDIGIVLGQTEQVVVTTTSKESVEALGIGIVTQNDF